MNWWVEWGVIAFIVLAIGYVVWRSGQANPQGTGELSAKLGQLSGKVGKLDTRIGHVEQRMKELEDEAATTKDIARIEERIQTVRAEVTGVRELTVSTNRGVERIEKILMERGLGR